jgi:hypothetical protein
MRSDRSEATNHAEVIFAHSGRDGKTPSRRRPMDSKPSPFQKPQKRPPTSQPPPEEKPYDEFARDYGVSKPSSLPFGSLCLTLSVVVFLSLSFISYQLTQGHAANCSVLDSVLTVRTYRECLAEGHAAAQGGDLSVPLALVGAVRMLKWYWKS